MSELVTRRRPRERGPGGGPGLRFLAGLLLGLADGRAALAEPAPANLVEVEIVGLRSSQGQVLCSLFSSAQGFPGERDRASALARSTISDGRALCAFSGPVPSTYAVALFHDENANGKLDRGFLGIPLEGVGASNDAPARFGPPEFDAASFRFSGGRLDLKITVHYR
jgi:uncharacterized protein (DUF2141 family)